MMLTKWWRNHILSFLLFFVSAAYTKDLFKSLLIIILFHLLLQVFSLSTSIKKRNRLRNANLPEIDTMEGIQFEHYLKELFKAMGYKVERTADSGDYGADLILRDGIERIVVQAKRYKGSVGIKAIQEVIGSKAYYNATQAWVVTNSFYTKAAIDLAKKANVQLFDRNGLVRFITSVKGQGNEPVDLNAKEIKNRYKDEIKQVDCPICSSPMVLRNSKRGVFYGCTKFPQCKGTRDSK